MTNPKKEKNNKDLSNKSNSGDKDNKCLPQ